MTMPDTRKLKRCNDESNIYIRFDVENNWNMFKNGIKRSMNITKSGKLYAKQRRKKKYIKSCRDDVIAYNGGNMRMAFVSAK